MHSYSFEIVHEMQKCIVDKQMIHMKQKYITIFDAPTNSNGNINNQKFFATKHIPITKPVRCWWDKKRDCNGSQMQNSRGKCCRLQFGETLWMFDVKSECCRRHTFRNKKNLKYSSWIFRLPLCSKSLPYKIDFIYSSRTMRTSKHRIWVL